MSRKSTSMSLDPAILSEARDLGINLSKAAEQGIVRAVQAERARLWKAENAQGIDDYNALITRDGVPLSQHRKF